MKPFDISGRNYQGILKKMPNLRAVKNYRKAATFIRRN